MTAAVGRHGVSVLAWVVMPERIHLIVYDEEARPLGPFLQTLKDPVAREVLARWRELDAAILTRLRSKAGSTHFWQAGGGYDRNVVDRKLIEKIRYVRGNPIERGLSPDGVSWKWSSARAYREWPDAIEPPVAFDLVPNHRGELT